MLGFASIVAIFLALAHAVLDDVALEKADELFLGHHEQSERWRIAGMRGAKLK